MSMFKSTAPPKLPTLPRGDQIAAFVTYLEAQKGVELLSDKGFPVQHVTIVGTDLKMVERVTGRLTYSRVAAAGLASGAWFGLFVGLVLSLFGGETTALPIFAAVGIGAGFGLLFSVLSFTMTRGSATSPPRARSWRRPMPCCATTSGLERRLASSRTTTRPVSAEPRPRRCTRPRR